MRLSLTLPAIGLLALMTTGCGSNQLNQSWTGQTPTSINPNSPTYGQAGGPDVPPNYPSAGATVAPAPPQREFTLYFETNSTMLSAEARSIVQQAVDAARQEPITRIAVTGHTDTVGTAHYNQGLSERRAAAVRQGLIAQGVSADEIVASGVGQSQLAVPTAHGVNEPRNRRVVITEGGPGM
jgi:outer membrane protein OmpA-like peptidoglycan-associated protein